MPDRLHFWICEIYQPEFEAVIQARRWDVQLHTLPQICILPRLCGQAIEKLAGAAADPDNHKLLVGGCSQTWKKAQENLSPVCDRCLDNCLHMICGRKMVDYLAAQGAYVLTSGWLKRWRRNLEHMGLDQPTAREFFHESARRLALLDTGILPDSAEMLSDFGAYLDLPVTTLPVGLEYLELYLGQIVSDWQNANIRRQAEANRAENNRQIADNAMALDLLAQLTRARSEGKAIEEISDLFTMLFSPETVSYFSVNEERLSDPLGCSLEESECKKLKEWTFSNDKAYAWTDSEEGFYLRLAHLGQTVGVLCVDRFQMPEYRQRYLNLSLSIANVCGLAIANTRLYQKLEETVASSMREKEISETLRQVMTELTSQLGLEDMLERILKSLFRVVPYSIAAIYMLDDLQLQFKAGVRLSPDGEALPYTFPLKSIDLSAAQQYPKIIPDSAVYPYTEAFYGETEIHGSLSIPLLLLHEPIGNLFIGHQQNNAYGEEQAALAQSFADQASIAIEKARLFAEIQTLAATDMLTGLYNRRHFTELADVEIKRARRYQRPLSLVMLDIDHFKSVNDTYGHAIGDLVIKEIAQCCLRNIRSVDIAGRIGGEEFVILLPETTLNNAVLLAERLRVSVFETRVPTELGFVEVTASLGVASLRDGCATIDDLVKQSDHALYRAKDAGRNRVST